MSSPNSAADALRARWLQIRRGSRDAWLCLAVVLAATFRYASYAIADRRPLFTAVIVGVLIYSGLFIYTRRFDLVSYERDVREQRRRGVPSFSYSGVVTYFSSFVGTIVLSTLVGGVLGRLFSG